MKRAHDGPLADGPTESAEEIHLPHQTIWPAVVAAGISLLLFGLLVGYAFSVVGAPLLVAGLVNWVSEVSQEAGGHD